MTTLESAIKKLDDDLRWKGPSGKQMAYSVLSREQAAAVLAALKQQQEQQ